MSACTPLCMCLIQAAIYLGREHRHMVRGSEVAVLGHLLQPMVSQNTRHTVPLCHRSMQDIIYLTTFPALATCALLGSSSRTSPPTACAQQLASLSSRGNFLC